MPKKRSVRTKTTKRVSSNKRRPVGKNLSRAVDLQEEQRCQNRWPWWISVVKIPTLLATVGTSELTPEGAAALLDMLSGAILDAHLDGNSDPLQMLNKASFDPSEWQLIEGVSSLSDVERDACCDHFGFFIRDGRPCSHPLEMWDGSDTPIGRIHRSLLALTSGTLSSKNQSDGWRIPTDRWQDLTLSFSECRALSFRRNSPVSGVIIPSVYSGEFDVSDTLPAWRMNELIGDIRNDYTQAADAIASTWKAMGGRSTGVDPVFEFLSDPTRATLQAAWLFVNARFAGLEQKTKAAHRKKNEGEIPNPKDVELVRGGLDTLGKNATRDGIQKELRNLHKDGIGNDSLTVVMNYLRTTGELKSRKRRSPKG